MTHFRDKILWFQYFIDKFACSFLNISINTLFEKHLFKQWYDRKKHSQEFKLSCLEPLWTDKGGSQEHQIFWWRHLRKPLTLDRVILHSVWREREREWEWERKIGREREREIERERGRIRSCHFVRPGFHHGCTFWSNLFSHSFWGNISGFKASKKHIKTLFWKIQSITSVRGVTN